MLGSLGRDLLAWDLLLIFSRILRGFPMPGVLQKSIRRIAVAVLLAASTAPAYADVPPPEQNSGWIGMIVYWIKLILHGEWKTLFDDLFFLVIFFGSIFGVLGLLGLLIKPIEKMVEREKEKEIERRRRLGIVTPPGGKSTFPINAVLLVRGIKSALGPKAEERQAAETAGSTGGTDPWKTARKVVQTDASSSTVAGEIKATLGTGALTAHPATAAPSAGSTAATHDEEIRRLTQPPAVEAATALPATPAKIPAVAAAHAAPHKNVAEPIPADHRPAPVNDPQPAASRRSVFISYRRRDSGHIAGRIYDRLVKAFGDKQVFYDVDSPMLGIDFREHIREKVSSSAVCIAVIGTQWNPLGASGQPRLSEAQDRVRIEIELALERGIPVIPVLVDGAEVPAEKDLPQSIAGLAYRNAAKVRYDPDFHRDMDRLVQGIEQHMK
jgi:hypothetical protein